MPIDLPDNILNLSSITSHLGGLKKKLSSRDKKISKQMQKVVNPSTLDLLYNQKIQHRVFHILDSHGSKAEKLLISLPTFGDGSCGLHALFGEYDPKKKKVYLKNIVEKRRKIADKVERQFHQKTIPPLIRKALIEYISNSAPKPLKEVFEQNEDIQILLARINSLEVNNDRREKLYDKIIYHPKVKNAYLAHLKDRWSYLSDYELGAIAIENGKKVNFYTELHGGQVLNMTYGTGNDIVNIRGLRDSQHFELAVLSTQTKLASIRAELPSQKKASLLNKMVSLSKQWIFKNPVVDQEENDLKLAWKLDRELNENSKKLTDREAKDQKIALKLHRQLNESKVEPSRKKRASSPRKKQIRLTKELQVQRDLEFAKRLQEYEDFKFAKQLQKREKQEREDFEFAKRLQELF